VFSLHALTTKQHQVDIEDTHVRLGNFEEIPHKNGVFQVNFFSETYTSISFSDILNNRFDPEILRDKIVLIGATAHDLHDEFLTPFARSQFMPGVIFHANALNTLRSKKYIHIIELPQQILLTVLISLALLALITRGQSILRSLLGTFFILFATIAGSIFAFMI
jgi:CHASE2 domain-containing sensor protein